MGLDVSVVVQVVLSGDAEYTATVHFTPISDHALGRQNAQLHRLWKSATAALCHVTQASSGVPSPARQKPTPPIDWHQWQLAL